MGTDDDDAWRSPVGGAGRSSESPDAQDRRIQGLRRPQVASRFGWKAPAQAAQKAVPTRSAYFPDDPEEDSISFHCEDTRRPSAVQGGAADKGPGQYSGTCLPPQSRAIFRLDHMISAAERGGAHGSIGDLQGEDKEREGNEEASGDCILPPPNRAIPIFFGDIRFPASRSILWPRHAIGPPVFVTSTDTAPLLLLSPSPLRPLLARLAQTSTNRRCRGTLLRLDLMPTSAAVNELSFSPYKSVVLPPAHALSLQPTQALEPFLEADSASELYDLLLEASLQQARAHQASPHSCFVPLLEVAGGNSPGSPWSCEATSEAGYRSLLSTLTRHLTTGTANAHTPTLLSTPALTPLRILATVSGPDCLCLRAEQALPALTIRFTPLDRLSVLNTSLYASLTSNPALGNTPRGEGDPPVSASQWGYLTLNDTRKVVVLLPTDPLIHERPLVGVWVANLTRQWDSEGQRHPLLWSTLLRYALSQDISERVSVESQTVLLAYFPCAPSPRAPAPSPSFIECKLLWPLPPPPPRHPLPLSFRLLDFSADLTLDEDEEEERTGEGAGDAWTPPIVGHFREVGHPSIATSFFRAQQQQQQARGPTHGPTSQEPISALTMESRYFPVPFPDARFPPRHDAAAAGSPTAARPSPPPPRPQPHPSPPTNQAEEKPQTPSSPSTPTPALQAQAPPLPAFVAPNAGDHVTLPPNPAAPEVDPLQRQQTLAAHQLILAQQEHLYVLQRQVQQLQALLMRQQPASTNGPLPVPSSSLLPPPLYQSPTSLIFPHSKALSPPRPPRTQPGPVKDAIPTRAESKSREGEGKKGSPSPPRPKGGAKPPSPPRAHPKAAPPTKPESVASDDEDEEEASVLRPIRLKAPTLDDLPPLPASPTEAAGPCSPSRPPHTPDRSSTRSTPSRYTPSRCASPAATIVSPPREEGEADPAVNTSTPALATDIPRIVYGYSSGEEGGGEGDGGDDESDGEGETIVRIQAKYQRMTEGGGAGK